MSLNNSSLFTKFNFINLLLSLFPLSFILGNLAINLNVALLVFSTILFYHKDLFTLKIFLFDKLIILLFAFILFTGIYNDIKIGINHKEFSEFRGYFATTIKSLFFFKYLFLYWIVKLISEKKIINFKLFFISCSFFSLFVCLDIYYQYILGKDIFGYLATPQKLSGPFGDEYIAGGYLQRFSIFALFLFPIFFKQNKKILYFIILFLFILFFISIILSGNRMPLVLFLFSIILIILFEKKIRKYLFPIFLIAGVSFFAMYSFSPYVKVNFINFYNQINKIIIIVQSKELKKNSAPAYHFREFSTFYHTWLMNKYVGGGIKNFRYYCHTRAGIDRELLEKNSKFICSTHPHNYYLEILTELGIFGFFIILIIFSLTLYLTLIKKYILNSQLKNNHIITPFLFIFIVEIFPVKSTGSFFTTGNSTFIFLVLAIILGLSKNSNLIETNHKKDKLI